MVGCVGADIFGRQLKQALGDAGVDHTHVAVEASVSSGAALIAVGDSAENMIIVIPGANGQVGAEALEKLPGLLAQARVLLLQLEIPMATVVAAAKIASQHGVQVILDPAPARMLPEALYPWLDIVTPNETEAELLVGFPIDSKTAAAEAALVLQRRGAKNVILKMGRRGAYALTDSQALLYAPFPVTALDTVAAGDAFNGALAVALSENKPLAEAIRWGMAGGALAVTRAGAQAAMPARSELLTMLGRTA